jgi:hypothetical protein
MKKLIDTIKDQEKIFASDADWKMKFDVVFKRHHAIIRGLLERCGISFDWYDPDTSYEEDVRAYMRALTELRERLEKLPDLPEPEGPRFRLDIAAIKEALTGCGVDVEYSENGSATGGEELELTF